MAAPSGGGGGGGPVGFSNSFTGPAQAIEIVGDFCYGYSGIVTSVSSAATLLEFTSGNHTIDATVLFELASEPGSGTTYWFDIEMNDQAIVRQILMDPANGKQPSDSDNMHIIIPPYTKCKFAGYAGSGDEQFCVILRGTVHR